MYDKLFRKINFVLFLRWQMDASIKWSPHFSYHVKCQTTIFIIPLSHFSIFFTWSYFFRQQFFANFSRRHFWHRIIIRLNQHSINSATNNKLMIDEFPYTKNVSIWIYVIVSFHATFCIYIVYIPCGTCTKLSPVHHINHFHLPSYFVGCRMIWSVNISW